MKISELKALLDTIQQKHGDIDVCCTAGYSVPENELMKQHHVAVATDDFVPSGAQLPYVLIGGDGLE